jgi:hypothetical protein
VPSSDCEVAVPTQINGLPAHVLLIHVVIAAIPIAALMLVASATWPAARARLGFLTPVVALVALVMVPITTNAGEWLRDHLGFTNARVRRHAELGDQLLPWAIGLFVLAVAVYLVGRRFEMTWRPSPSESHDPVDGVDGGAGGTATMTRSATRKQALPVWATAVLAVLSVAVAVGTLIQLYRIGDSGAQSVWHGVGTGGH